MDFNDLSFDFNSSSILINNHKFKIYAHENELLSEHIEKTLLFFHQIADENILKKFHHNLTQENHIKLNYEEFIHLIELFIFYHDIGKLSWKFQIKHLNKYNYPIKEKQIDILKNTGLNSIINDFSKNHSFSSSLCFLTKNIEKLNNNDLFIFVLIYAIYSHHTYLKDLLSNDGFTYKELDKIELKTIWYLIIFLNIATVNEIENMKYDPSFFQTIQKDSISNLNEPKSTLSFFYNYIYSLLICADVLASKEYETMLCDVENLHWNNFIDYELQNKMIKSFYNVDYNKDLKNTANSENISKLDNINELRANMLLESSFNLNNHLNNHIFFLNMPTGGGKTNTSMKLALDLIENTNAKRIIYAMPFINIIEQNYDVIKDNFGLNEDNGEIRKIYSATETLFNDEDDEYKSKIILQDSFFNYPVICTTFSTFFDGILRTAKRYKYKIASYANSVVILDEIQSLPIKNWNSLYYIICEIADKYNIYFIIMSATLPKFDKLKLDYENKFRHEKPIQLINCPEKYFNHYIFDRTKIKENIKELELNNTSTVKDYFHRIIEDNFNQGYNKGLIVLNTIKSSKVIYNILNEIEDIDFNIDLLNSSLMFNVKKEIIYKINNMKNSDSKRYVLISTQSIEAGVDVSFDFVIRDFATLDSIEQIRGRCNRSRELNKNDPYKKGNIYLINLKDKHNNLYKYIYNNIEINSRILETQNILNDNLNYKYEDIIRYYDNVSENLNLIEDNHEENFIISDRENVKNWNEIKFSKLQDKTDGIHIIDNNLNQYSLFIPTKLYIFTENMDDCINVEYEFDNLKEFYDEHEKKFIFSYDELEFLKHHQKDSDYNILCNNYVDGEELINFYEEYINKIDNTNFESIKIIQKEFSSIINKFIINITLNNFELESKIIDEYDSDFRKLNYFYILNPELIGDDEFTLYSLKTGLNENFFNVEIL